MPTYQDVTINLNVKLCKTIIETNLWKICLTYQWEQLKTQISQLICAAPLWFADKIAEQLYLLVQNSQYFS